MKTLKYIALLVCSTLLLSACNMLDIQPVGKVIPTTLSEYRALLGTAYKTMPSANGLASFRSDEMYVHNKMMDQAHYGQIESWDDFTPRAETATFEWKNFYSVIFTTNYIIEKQAEITEGTTDEVNQLVGECYLLRAYMHFSLVNLYGQPYTAAQGPESKSIPLKLSSDINQIPTRNTVKEVYAAVLRDIDMAGTLINQPAWEKKFSYRFNTLSVQALRSRVNLYMGNWDEAAKAAEAVLAQKDSLEDFNAADYKLPNNYLSVENFTALELPVNTNYFQVACASDTLLKLYHDGDLRKNAYFKTADNNGYRYTLKAGRDEFRCSFRTAEMYLNAAEADARMNKSDEARTRLLSLMQKRLTPTAFTLQSSAIQNITGEALISEILNERARELAFEGHRWFDLRRTTRPRIQKNLNGKTVTLEQDDARYTIRIPQEAIDANPGLAN